MSVRNAYLCTRNQEMVLDCRGSLKNHFEKIVPEFGKLKKGLNFVSLSTSEKRDRFFGKRFGKFGKRAYLCIRFR